MAMKTLVPWSCLLVGLLLSGCTTQEEILMSGATPIGVNPAAVVKPAPPAAPVAATPPATPVLIVPAQNPKPVAPPVAVAKNPPPVAHLEDAAPAATAVPVPDDAMPAPTKPAETAPAIPVAGLPKIVTPDTSLSGKVVVYNPSARFVVLSFPGGIMPQPGQTVFLYRGGLKVGETKITGTQRDDNTVGDIVNGDAQVGDEARNQ